MKEFSYSKLATIIILIATVFFGAFTLLDSNHAVDPSHPGNSIVHPGEENITLIIDCTSASTANRTNLIVRVDAKTVILGQLIDGICYVPLPVEFTYEDHYYTIDFWKYEPIWYTKVIPWDTINPVNPVIPITNDTTNGTVENNDIPNDTSEDIGETLPVTGFPLLDVCWLFCVIGIGFVFWFRD
ncbi:MAG: hypothetical protein CfClM3_0151 [Methanobrevibacter sp. CfCl-M3]